MTGVVCWFYVFRTKQKGLRASGVFSVLGTTKNDGGVEVYKLYCYTVAEVPGASAVGEIQLNFTFHWGLLRVCVCVCGVCVRVFVSVCVRVCARACICLCS